MPQRPFITFTSDFGVQSQGVGIMEGVILSINPEVHVIHLMHGLPSFDVTCAARTLETAKYLPVGFHVCVVDPGVGTKRNPIIIKAKRGDCLIGPDNGVLIPATRFLGGHDKTVKIQNPDYMRHPISPIFHGRDIFAPAAAHLAAGVPLTDFGPELLFDDLVKGPYEEATLGGDQIHAKVIHINKYGSLHLNILNEWWDQFKVMRGQKISIHFAQKNIEITHVETFGDVEAGQPLVLKDDYGRVEVAINLGNFSEIYTIAVGDHCVLKKTSQKRSVYT